MADSMTHGPVQAFLRTPAYSKRLFRDSIRAWFDQSGRDFPWRDAGTPYEVLVAEIMLQQTNAAKVTAIYRDFLREFPSSTRLASARKNSVAKYVAKLGLAYRTERLIRIARAICDKFDGKVPQSEEELVSLPGIGKYVARAVLSGAMGHRLAILDTNVIRLLDRYFGIRSARPRPRTDPELWNVAQQLLPRPTSDCRNWNYALLDFGAAVCSYYGPSCQDCGCSSRCQYALRSARQS